MPQAYFPNPPVDRELIHPVQKTGPALTVVPAACGWSAVAVTARGETSEQSASSFAEAVTVGFALADELRLTKSGEPLPLTVELATRYGVYERLTLPSTDPEELAGMVRLQFEKSLPYPLEETSVGFQILSQTAEPAPQTTLLAFGAHHPALSTLCAPLLERHQAPQRLSLWAAHLAAQAPAGEVACGLWREEDRLVFGIFESARLGFVEVLSAAESDVLAALPRTLMSAEMAGAPTGFHAVYLDPSLSSLAQPLEALLGAPVRELDLQGAEPAGDAIDLTPEPWRAEQARRLRMRQWRGRLILAGALYAALLLLGLLWLGIQSGRLTALKKQAVAMQPQVDGIIDRQTRWKALAPAIERERYALEILFATYQSLPSPETRITQFDLSREQFMVEGEAPDAQTAIGVAEKLKKQPALGDYRIESGQPVILPNEHAQFRIFGK